MIRYALFGDPVEHSLSPQLQNAAFQAAGIDAEYVAVHVTAHDLPLAVEGIRRRDFAGANVTIPHKRAVIDMADVVTDEAKAIRAANWLALDEKGQLVADNTDLLGFTRSLEEAKIAVAGRMVVVFGAGGAARAAVLGLLRMGATRVVVGARRAEEGARLANDLGAASILPMGIAMAKQSAMQADLVVSAVPPKAWADVAPMALAQGTWVVDLAYDPRGTPAERWALAKGLRAMGGLSMLLHQGALSFERWTKQRFPMQAAREALLGEVTPTGEKTADPEVTPPSRD